MGRAPEQSVLERLLSDARRGNSRVLVLRGEPGVGKTALCCDALARAHARGFTGLTARPVESESELPFAGLSELLSPVLELRERIPEPQAAALAGALALGPPTTQGRFPVCVATLSLLAAAAAERPLLVVVDDAQWLDGPSAEAVSFAARRLSADRVALLLVLREGEPDEYDLRGFDQLPVHGLSLGAQRDLLRQWLGDAIAESVAERLTETAGGNPLALAELVRGLSDAQRRGEEPLIDPLPVGAELQATFLSRCAELPPATRAALLVAAAANSADRGIVDQALTSCGLDVMVLHAAEDAGLITLDRARVEFRHPLTRSAIYHGATATERRDAHAALAKALVEDPSRRAWQLASAAAGPDEPAAQALQEAANTARHRGAHATSTRMLQRAAELTSDPTLRARRLLYAASSAHVAGRTKLAVDLVERARPPADDSILRARIQHLRGTLEQFGGSPRRACELLTAEAVRVKSADPRRCALMLADAAMIAGMSHDIDAGIALAQRALAAAAGDELLATMLDGFGQNLRVIRGDAPGPGPLTELAATLVDTVDATSTVAWMVQLAAIDLVYAERYEQAADLFDCSIDKARSQSAISALAPALTNRADLRSRTGQWTAAYADAFEAVALAKESGQRNVQAFALGVIAWLEAAAGRGDSCRALRAEGLAIAETVGFGGGQVKAQATTGLLELGLGDFEAAAVTLEDARRGSQAHGVRNCNIVLWAGDLVEACTRAELTDQAHRRLEELEAAAELTDSRWGIGVALRNRSLLDTDERAGDRFAAALARLASLPFERARTHLAWGQWLRRRGKRTEARGQLERALEDFERLGAAPWATQAQIELGVSVVTARRRPGAAAAERLTAQELQVAMIVAEGVTNREAAAKLFLSPRTIGAHLERIYRKLGINRRGQLSNALRDQSSGFQRD